MFSFTQKNNNSTMNNNMNNETFKNIIDNVVNVGNYPTHSDFVKYLNELQREFINDDNILQVIQFITIIDMTAKHAYHEEFCQYSMEIIRSAFGICLDNGLDITSDQVNIGQNILLGWMNNVPTHFDPQGLLHLLNEMAFSGQDGYRAIATLQSANNIEDELQE